jgi:hypothetical protein
MAALQAGVGLRTPMPSKRSVERHNDGLAA